MNYAKAKSTEKNLFINILHIENKPSVSLYSSIFNEQLMKGLKLLEISKTLIPGFT